MCSSSIQRYTCRIAPLLIIASLIIGLRNNVYANRKHTDPIILHVAVSGEKREKETNSTSGLDSSRFIAGKIVDQITKSSLSGATVIVEGGRLAVTTDVNGGFKLFVPDHVTTDTIQLTVTSANYFNQTLTYAIKDFPLHVLVELKPGHLLVELKRVSECLPPPLLIRTSCCFMRKPTMGQRLKMFFLGNHKRITI